MLETQYPKSVLQNTSLLCVLALESSFNWIVGPKYEIGRGLEVSTVLQGVDFALSYLKDYENLLSQWLAKVMFSFTYNYFSELAMGIDLLWNYG